MDNSQEREILEMLAKNEDNIGKLYQMYAEKFPEQKIFWYELSAEESVHAGWIRALDTRIGQDSLSFDYESFAVQWIKDSIESVEVRLVADMDNKKMTLISALAMAFKLEHSMVEDKIFEVFHTDSAELKIVLQNLIDGTTAHRTRIKKLWDKLRGL
jgi:hypothetical protein